MQFLIDQYNEEPNFDSEIDEKKASKGNETSQDSIKKIQDKGKFVMNDMFAKVNKFHKDQQELCISKVENLQNQYDQFEESVKIEGMSLNEVRKVIYQRLDQLELLK